MLNVVYPAAEKKVSQTAGRNPAVIILLAALTLSAYWGAWRADFVFDDHYLVFETHIRSGLTPGNACWALTTLTPGNWYPLTLISHMLDVTLFGLGAAGPHLINVLWHAGNTVFLFLLLKTLTGRFIAGSLVAALFAVHPLHLESVAWVSSRKDVLSVFFGFAALAAYQAYARRPGALRYAAVLTLLFISLTAKPMWLMFPALALGLDFWPLGRLTDMTAKGWRFKFRLSVFWEKLPMLVLVTMDAAVTFFAQNMWGATMSRDQFPLGMRLGNAVMSYPIYLKQLLWPAGLAAYYPHPRAPASWLWLSAAIILVAAATLAALWRSAGQPYFLAGWSWYLISLLPFIGLIQVGEQARADRYAYVPMIGIYVFLVWGGTEVFKPPRKWRVSGAVLVLAIIVSLFIVSRLLLPSWRDDLSLFNRALRVTDGNWMAHNNVAVELERLGRYEEALNHYKESMRLRPGFLPARDNVKRLTAAGRTASEIESLREALSLQQDNHERRLALADSLLSRGNAVEAINQYRELLRRGAGDRAAIYLGLGNALAWQKDYPAAESAYRQALAIRDDAEAMNNLGNALAAQGRFSEAAKAYEASISLRPDFLAARNNLAVLKDAMRAVK